jgi:polynucleotide 5'-hydroxyl-kinase GRC3/NOL9
MSAESVVVPDAWLDLDFAALHGVLFVVGAPDTGKSTFAQWLFGRLAGRRHDQHTAFLDGDVGQSVLGPPTTLTLGMSSSNVFKDLEILVRWFVGDVSPRGHMLPLVVGAGRLARRAFEVGAETVIVDTTGLVDQAQGGVALKHALVDELQPTTLFALRRADELEPILDPLRLLPHPRVVELPVINVVHRRDAPARQAHRARAFHRYFTTAGVLRLSLRERAVFGGHTFAPRRLLALRDAGGFTLALGVVLSFSADDDELIVHTPSTDAGAVASVQLGAIGVDTATGRELRPGRKV